MTISRTTLAPSVPAASARHVSGGTEERPEPRGRWNLGASGFPNAASAADSFSARLAAHIHPDAALQNPSLFMSSIAAAAMQQVDRL